VAGEVEFHVGSKQEFLKEGAATAHFMRDCHLLTVPDIGSAEMAEWSATAKAAIRGSSLDMSACGCDTLGADVTRVPHEHGFVRRGVGPGGSSQTRAGAFECSSR
jgi:hypothetical protein